MGGAADSPHRSSSPLKRRASSMDQEMQSDSKDDVDMVNLPPLEKIVGGQNGSGSGSGSGSEGDHGMGGLDGPDPVPDSAPSPTDSQSGFKKGIPPLPEQIKTIETLLKAFNDVQLQEGSAVYLVSRQWLAKAQALGGDPKHAPKEPVEEPLGPVDNSDIIHSVVKDVEDKDFVRLKPGMNIEHYQVFPPDAWDLLVSWHGIVEGQLPIRRLAHDTAPDSGVPNVEIEVHPPVFTIHRLWSANSPIPIDQKLKATGPPAIQIACSTSHPLMAFLAKVKKTAGIDTERKVRMWRITRSQAAGPDGAPGSSTSASAQAGALSTPPDSPGGPSDEEDSWDYLLLEASRLMALTKGVEREELQIKDHTNDANYNGKSKLAFYSLQGDDTLVLDESVDSHGWVSTYKGNLAGNGKEKGIATRASTTSLLTAANRANTSGRSSPALSGPMTRGRAKAKSGRTVGCVGLSNLGNTCYMNSALQCVRSVEELTKYFLVGEAEKEINTDNPLAHNGDVAMVYHSLLRDVYKDPAPASLAPRQFKTVIGRYAPAFSGYGQQDSQEFVGFLLDALQEDLSRIKKKPYIEKPDSTDDMINDPQAIREMAAKVWDITKKRDDSVIADLFTGMYKSTLVCPVCEKVSITFDPFNNLTLPLPVQNVWSKAVRYYPLNDAPVEINVELDKNSSIKSLKEYISIRVGVPIERLIGAEEFKDKFFKIYDDYSCVSDEIGTNDAPVIFELECAPTNTGFKRPKKKYSTRSMLLEPEEEAPMPDWDDPLTERLVVPVIHRFQPSTTYRKRPTVTVTPPHFIIVTREQARNEDAIRRKILEKVATFSTWSEFSHMDEADTTDNTDLEMVTAPASDADSSGDGKVTAKSVEGEDDLVDVSTTKPIRLSGSNQHAVPKPLKAFNKRKPKWVDSREYLHAGFQSLFSMAYFSESDTGIPSGWHSVTDGSAFPLLASRAPPPPDDVDMRSPGAAGTDDSSSEESARQPVQHSVEMAEMTRMADESSDDEDIPAQVNHCRRLHPAAKPKQVGGRRVVNRKPQRTYGKGNKRRGGKVVNNHSAGTNTSAYNSFDSLTVIDSPPSPSGDNGPLIRLGEGIVVSWEEEAWETVFGKANNYDNSRGEPTFLHLESLQDPALLEKRRLRAQRRKNGITLDDCLDEFEKEEILSEQDTWYCPRCKEHRRASKKFDLWKTPDILVVHLKRFSSSGWRRDKLDILVEFPIEGLDLTRRVIEQESGKEVYDLIAIDDHWGGLGGGHYTAFAKNFIDGEWYEYNDSSVSKQKDLSRMVTSAAYLLFYRRRSNVPLGGPRFQQINEHFNDSDSNPDDDMSDSGEGQRLDAGSSLRGSSSALTGAEATRPRGGRGFLSRVNRATASVGESSGDGIGNSSNSNGNRARIDEEADADADADGDVDNPLPQYGQAIRLGPQGWPPANDEEDNDLEAGGVGAGAGTEELLRGSIEDEGIGGMGAMGVGGGGDVMASFSGWGDRNTSGWSWNLSVPKASGPGSAASDEADGGNSSDGGGGGYGSDVGDVGTLDSSVVRAGLVVGVEQFENDFDADQDQDQPSMMGQLAAVAAASANQGVGDEDGDEAAAAARMNLEDIRQLSFKAKESLGGASSSMAAAASQKLHTIPVDVGDLDGDDEERAVEIHLDDDKNTTRMD